MHLRSETAYNYRNLTEQNQYLWLWLTGFPWKTYSCVVKQIQCDDAITHLQAWFWTYYIPSYEDLLLSEQWSEAMPTNHYNLLPTPTEQLLHPPQDNFRPGSSLVSITLLWYFPIVSIVLWVSTNGSLLIYPFFLILFKFETKPI